MGLLDEIIVPNTKHICPKCKNGELYQRKGIDGKSDFYSCSYYPKCHYKYSIDGEETKRKRVKKPTKYKGDTCPSCASNEGNEVGFLVKRRGVYGSFLGCSRFPRCKYTNREA
jgi:DNA topoisomerase-1